MLHHPVSTFCPGQTPVDNGAKFLNSGVTDSATAAETTMFAIVFARVRSSTELRARNSSRDALLARLIRLKREALKVSSADGFATIAGPRKTLADRSAV